MTDDLSQKFIPTADQALQLLNSQVTEQQRRLSEARAREHVGAAGWAQANLLEDIIRAGRDQFAATDALRQVIQLTSGQLRALPLSAGQEARDDHRRTLQDIVASGQQQVSAAQALEEVIQLALRDVVDTPMQELSAAQLGRIHAHLQEQLSALSLMMEAARSQAGTLDQMQALDEVSAAYQERVDELGTLSAEKELDQLAAVGGQVMSRIAELDEAGEKQLETLEVLGESALRQVSDTGASRSSQLRTLEYLREEAGREAAKLQGKV